MRTETLGPGGFTLPVRPISNTLGYLPGRHVSPMDEILTLDELIALREKEANQSRFGSQEQIFKSAQVSNLRYIKDHGPQTLQEKAEKEITLNDLAKLLMDFAGFGSAIASIVPIPEVRAAGIVAQTANSAIRAASRGNWESASRSINRGVRSYNYALGQSSKARKRR